MTATDNTFHPTGCVRDAQALAADLFGAQATFFLTAGSTLGVATALLAAVPPGATVALPRNIHRSVVAGLVLSGALPRFMPHDVLPECGALGVSPSALADSARRRPEAGGRAADAAELLRPGARPDEHVARLPIARRAADRRRSARRAFCISCRRGRRSRRSRPARTSSSRVATRRSARSSARRSCTSAASRWSSPTQVQRRAKLSANDQPELFAAGVARRDAAPDGPRREASCSPRPSTTRSELERRDRTTAGLARVAAGERSAAGRPSARSAAAGRERERHRLERLRSRTVSAHRVPRRRRNGGLVQRGLYSEPAG